MSMPGTPMKTPMRSDRRAFLSAGLVGIAALALPRAAFALTDAQATALITRAVNDVNSAIATGKTGPALYGAFENIFNRYADVPTIARSALGPAARSASAAQMSGFTSAFRGYLARKYGRRFNEFTGARFEVQGARQVKGFYEVKSVAYLPGQSPFEVLWHVSDKSGKDLFFNIIIEGVNMLAAERTEIGSMLDARRGNIDALIGDLNKAT